MKKINNNYEDINDNQEKLHFQFSSIREKKVENFGKIREEIQELELLRLILYILITSGIIFFLF